MIESKKLKCQTRQEDKTMGIAIARIARIARMAIIARIARMGAENK